MAHIDFPNGDTYEGNVLNGLPHGRGTLTRWGGESVITGVWWQGKSLHGLSNYLNSVAVERPPKFDEEFWTRFGFGGLSSTAKRKLSRRLKDECETRVGEQISQSLSQEELREFDRILSGDSETIQKVLRELKDYHQDSRYQALRLRHMSHAEALKEYVSIAWIVRHCPNYREHVRLAVGGFMDELVHDWAFGTRRWMPTQGDGDEEAWHIAKNSHRQEEWGTRDSTWGAYATPGSSWG